MECFVCNHEMTPYFQKRFTEYEVLSNCEYIRCENCGMVIAKTIYELDADSWQRLNQSHHSSYQGTEHDPDVV